MYECIYASTHVFIYSIPYDNMCVRVLELFHDWQRFQMIHQNTFIIVYHFCWWISNMKFWHPESETIYLTGNLLSQLRSDQDWDSHCGNLHISIHGSFLKWRDTSKRWVSILTWSHDLDAFGMSNYPYDFGNAIFRKLATVMLSLDPLQILDFEAVFPLIPMSLSHNRTISSTLVSAEMGYPPKKMMVDQVSQSNFNA